MIRFFRFLFTGSWHEHSWKILRQGPRVDPEYKNPIGHYYDMQCEHCGKIKNKKT